MPRTEQVITHPLVDRRQMFSPRRRGLCRVFPANLRAFRGGARAGARPCSRRATLAWSCGTLPFGAVHPSILFRLRFLLHPPPLLGYDGLPSPLFLCMLPHFPDHLYSPGRRFWMGWWGYAKRQELSWRGCRHRLRDSRRPLGCEKACEVQWLGRVRLGHCYCYPYRARLNVW